MFKICHYQLRKRKLCLFEQDYFEKRPVHHYIPTIHNRRSSCPEVFFKKGVLRNFAKFTGEHLCQSLFFNKVAGGACNFIKKETLAQVFSCEFCEISKNTFFHRTPLVAASVTARNSAETVRSTKCPHQ